MKEKRRILIYTAMVLGMVLCLTIFSWAASHYFGQRSAYRQAKAEYQSLRSYGPSNACEPQHSSDPQSQAAVIGEVSDVAVIDEAGKAAVIGEIGETAVIDEAGEAAYESPVDFDALRAVNPEVVAWIEIPGTQVSYPIVQAADNDAYLGTSFSGNQNNSGAIFLDYACQSDLCGQHSIIYGHNMKNGSMFASLTNYKDADFFAEHPEILLYTPNETIRLRVIAAYAERADAGMRQTEFEKDELAEFIRQALSRYAYSPELDVGSIRQLYTFATCSYEWNDSRTWVHAVKWFD